MSTVGSKLDFSTTVPSTGSGQVHDNSASLKNQIRPEMFNEYERIMATVSTVIGNYEVSDTIPSCSDNIGAGIREVYGLKDTHVDNSGHVIIPPQNNVGTYCTEINCVTLSGEIESAISSSDYLVMVASGIVEGDPAYFSLLDQDDHIVNYGSFNYQHACISGRFYTLSETFLYGLGGVSTDPQTGVSYVGGSILVDGISRVSYFEIQQDGSYVQHNGDLSDASTTIIGGVAYAGDFYMIGFEENSDLDDTVSAAVWRNGTRSWLERTGTGSSWAYDIDVNYITGKTYVCGAEDITDGEDEYDTATIWEDGKIVYQSNPSELGVDEGVLTCIHVENGVNPYVLTAGVFDGYICAGVVMDTTFENDDEVIYFLYKPPEEEYSAYWGYVHDLISETDLYGNYNLYATGWALTSIIPLVYSPVVSSGQINLEGPNWLETFLTDLEGENGTTVSMVREEDGMHVFGTLAEDYQDATTCRSIEFLWRTPINSGELGSIYGESTYEPKNTVLDNSWYDDRALILKNDNSIVGLALDPLDTDTDPTLLPYYVTHLDNHTYGHGTNSFYVDSYNNRVGIGVVTLSGLLAGTQSYDDIKSMLQVDRDSRTVFGLEKQDYNASILVNAYVESGEVYGFHDNNYHGISINLVPGTADATTYIDFGFVDKATRERSSVARITKAGVLYASGIVNQDSISGEIQVNGDAYIENLSTDGFDYGRETTSRLLTDQTILSKSGTVSNALGVEEIHMLTPANYDSGGVYVNTTNGLFGTIGDMYGNYAVISSTNANEVFRYDGEAWCRHGITDGGSGCSIFEHELAVGPGDNDTCEIYRITEKGLEHIQSIEGEMGDPGSSRFAETIALGDNVLFVSARDETVGGYSRAGQLWVYEKGSSGEWENTQVIDAPDPATDGKFGFAMKIYRTYAIVTAPGALKAYILEKNSTTGLWSVVNTIIPDDTPPGTITADRCDVAYTEDGITFLWGIPDGGVSGYGQVLVIRQVNGEWQVAQVLDNPGTTAYYGYGTCISGNIIIIGDMSYNAYAGIAYLYRRDDTTGEFELEFTIEPKEGSTTFQMFGGYSMIRGNNVIITKAGRSLQGSPVQTGVGAAFVFELTFPNYLTAVRYNTLREGWVKTSPFHNTTPSIYLGRSSVAVSGYDLPEMAFPSDNCLYVETNGSLVTNQDCRLYSRMLVAKNTPSGFTIHPRKCQGKFPSDNIYMSEGEGDHDNLGAVGILKGEHLLVSSIDNTVCYDFNGYSFDETTTLENSGGFWGPRMGSFGDVLIVPETMDLYGTPYGIVHTYVRKATGFADKEWIEGEYTASGILPILNDSVVQYGDVFALSNYVGDYGQYRSIGFVEGASMWELETSGEVFPRVWVNSEFDYPPMGNMDLYRDTMVILEGIDYDDYMEGFNFYGLVRVLEYNNGTWEIAQSIGELVPSGELGGFPYGVAEYPCTDISINGDVLAIAYGMVSGHPSEPYNDCSVVVIYRHDGTEWVQEHIAAIPKAGTNENYGYAVSVCGDNILIRPVDDTCGPTVISYDGSKWTSSDLSDLHYISRDTTPSPSNSVFSLFGDIVFAGDFENHRFTVGSIERFIL